MTDRAGPGTVALVCPDCGQKLRAPRGDVLFSCAGCGRVSEVSGGRLRTLPALFPHPRAGAGEPDLRLPVFAFGVEVEYAGEDRDALEQLERMVRPRLVFVPAFRQRSVLAFGDMGLVMTLDPPDMAGGGSGTFAGATLVSDEAARLVQPVVLWRADQVHDLTGVEVEVDITGVKVLGIPARDEGERLVDLLSGRQWPVAAFLDIDALRWKPGDHLR